MSWRNRNVTLIVTFFIAIRMFHSIFRTNMDEEGGDKNSVKCSNKNNGGLIYGKDNFKKCERRG